MSEQTTSQTVVLTFRVSEMEQVKLLLWELNQLVGAMRVGASPFADRAERMLDRFLDGTDTTEDAA